ncbi:MULTISPECIES: Pr6Pr family membrane protein [unclassified Streptomyces]|uniref:Pr6Pr family membrane protein n=1 Tax=unclassified Streptomyces TaxID=2593676 RepID=UPI00278BD9C3|nr:MULTISPECIES: Pr6Pr family membrane protein [unclassified Streptomyces]
MIRHSAVPNPSPSLLGVDAYSTQMRGGAPYAVGSTPICAPCPKPPRYMRLSLRLPSLLSWKRRLGGSFPPDTTSSACVPWTAAVATVFYEHAERHPVVPATTPSHPTFTTIPISVIIGTTCTTSLPEEAVITITGPAHSAAVERASGASRLWHGVLAVVVLAALVTQLALVFTGGSAAGAGDTTRDQAEVGTRLVRMFSYFTIQSNILVLLCAVSLVLRPQRDGPVWRVLRLDALLGITITGLVFAIVLAPQVHLEGVSLWVTVGLHYVAPPMTLVGWLAFGPRGRIDAGSVAWAFVWPVLWIAYTLAHGAVTDWYPYPFLDVHARGYGLALRNIAGVIVVAVVLVCLFAWLDRVITRRLKRPLPLPDHM